MFDGIFFPLVGMVAFSYVTLYFLGLAVNKENDTTNAKWCYGLSFFWSFVFFVTCLGFVIKNSM